MVKNLRLQIEAAKKETDVVIRKFDRRFEEEKRLRKAWNVEKRNLNEQKFRFNINQTYFYYTSIILIIIIIIILIICFHHILSIINYQLFSLEQKVSLLENEIIQLKNQLSKYENQFISSGINNLKINTYTPYLVKIL